MATVGVRHSKVVSIPDDPNYPVGSDEWNADHVITGLENVDNTSDLNKPVSTAQAAADATVAANAATATALKANIASPALTGTPTAPTAAPGTNTTQISTTAFVQAAVAALVAGAPGALDTLKELADAINDDASYAATITSALALKAPLASPTLTGTPAAPTAAIGTNTTQIATTAFVRGSAAPVAGGRLTTASGAPVQTTDTVAATSIYYAPYGGSFVSLYNGTSFIPYSFTSSATDAVGLTLALGSNWAANTLFDCYVTLNGGVPVLGTVAFTSSGAGTSARATALQPYNGMWTNAASMTLRINNTTTITVPANQGSYVGTFLTSGSAGQIDLKFGTAAASGGAAVLSIYNAYNRVNVRATVSDTTASWAYTTNSWRAANAGSTKATIVDGLGAESTSAGYHDRIQTIASGSAFGAISVGLNSSTAVAARATSTLNICGSSTIQLTVRAEWADNLPVGLNVLYAIELGDGANANVFYGQNASVGCQQQLTVLARM